MGISGGWEQIHMIQRLWQMSLQASLLIGFVLLLRLLLRRCSKGYAYALWLLVLLRLLCPVFIESGYSLQPVIGTAVYEGVVSADENAADGNAEHITDKNGVTPDALPDVTETMQYESSPDAARQGKEPDGGALATGTDPVSKTAGGSWLRLSLLQGIYVLGVLLFFLGFAVQYLLWKRKLRTAVLWRENIWQSDRIGSPFVLGIIRPRIYLPYGLKEEERKHILLHEQMHIRHRDPLLRLMGTAAVCLHWWNPLVWLGMHLFYQDMEMFCDEAAVGKEDLAYRRAYSETLLRFAARQSGLGMPLAFGETHTEQRIRNILRQNKKGLWITLAVAMAAIAGCLLFLTVPEETTNNLVLSEGQTETAEGLQVTVQLVLTEGSCRLMTLDTEGQVLDETALFNPQGDAAMNFPCRDFPWYFADYNLDGQQDFFLGTKGDDGRNYYYFFTITKEGKLSYLYDGAMEEDYWPMTAENITNPGLESGGAYAEDGRQDFRRMLLYQMNDEYSSHDYYTWSPYSEKYLKRVDYTGVYPEGQDPGAVEELEGSWRITGAEIWNPDNAGPPESRIGEILRYTEGTFQQLDRTGNMAYEEKIMGCSSQQGVEEFGNMYGYHTEPERRILLNLGEACQLGNVIFRLDENTMLVYDLADNGVFWKAVREKNS